MKDLRTPVIEAVSAYGPAVEALYGEIMQYVIEKLGEEDNPCIESRSSQECMQIGDLIIHHFMMEVFLDWFNWQFDWKE